MKKIITILIIALIAFTSCRSVKKDKTTLKEVLKTEDVKKETETVKQEDNSQVKEEIKINSETGTVTKKTTYKPSDPSKPSSVTDKKGNNIILDNAELIEEETTSNNKTVTDEKKDSSLISKKDTFKKLEEEKKATAEKKQQTTNVTKSFPTMELIIALLILFVVAITFYNRKNILSWLKKTVDKIWWL